ncbi:MAG: hypothetical protein GXP19_06380 [Gammaproteobacteria bacterium]|nr:hypothetical protein [Gammaproteobacteria bacterium]
MTKLTAQTTESVRPDLDWSQVKETVLMLHFAVSYIQQGLRDGDESVNTLTDSFTNMVENTSAISDDISHISDEAVKDKVMKRCSAIREQMHAAIIAFQFYDKLTQRLGHVSTGLSGLSSLVSDPDRIYNPNQWHDLQKNIKSKFTIAEDRNVFEEVLKGKSVEEVLKTLNSDSQKTKSDSEIELF